MRLSTRARLYTILASVITLVVTFGLLWVVWSTFIVRERTAELSRQVVALAHGLDAVDQAGVSSAAVALRQTLFRVEADLLGVGLFVVDTSGRVVRTSGDIRATAVPLSALSAPDVEGVRTGVRTGASGVQALIVAAPVSTGEWLVAVQPLSEIVSARREITLLLGVAVAFAAFAALLFGTMFGRRLSAPLANLREGAEAVAAGDFAARVPESGDAEIVSLARSFNRMAERVQDTYNAQKAFIGDVSHELRTPVTSIRGFAEAIWDGTVTDEAGIRHSAEIIVDEADRMDELSRTLLAVAELDSEAVEIRREPIDLGVFVSAMEARFGRAAQDAGTRLTIDIPAQPRPLGDASRLIQATSALVSNSLAYAAGGQVRVSAIPHDGMWSMAVEDDGPGIPQDRREEVFGRFSRLESSRSTRNGGVGLGLFIARRATERMGGTVHVEDPVDLGGARVVLELPLS